MDSYITQSVADDWAAYVHQSLGISSKTFDITDGHGKYHNEMPMLIQNKGKDTKGSCMVPPVINQRKSSLSNIRVAPLNIQKAQSNISNASSVSTTKALTSKALYTPPISSRDSYFKNKPVEISKVDEAEPSFRSSSQTSPQSRHRSSNCPETPCSAQTCSFNTADEENIAERLDNCSILSHSSVSSIYDSLIISDRECSRSLERIRRKHNCARELYSTEYQFAQDMAVVVRIYMCGSGDIGLSVRQIDSLFSNVSQVFDVSLSVVAILESHIPIEILQGDGNLKPLDIAADKDLKIGKAMCLALNGQLYEVYESYIHHSQNQTDLYFEITQALRKNPQKNHNLAPKKSQNFNIDEAKLANWLKRCQQRVSKLTTAWSLDSLLIKPIQRLGKYPLFLKTLLDCTDVDHQDYEDLKRAYQRSKHYLDCVNARFGAASLE